MTSIDHRGLTMLQERTGAGLHDHLEGVIATQFPERDLAIIDIGCGTGAFLQRLARLGYRDLQGMDIAPPSIAAAPIRFHAADADEGQLPVSTGSCDLAILIEFIEHVENPGLLLAELTRIVRPGGFILLTTPNTHSLEARLRWLLMEKLKQFDALGDPTHITPVFLFPFLRMCTRHGLEPARRWGYPEDGGSPTSRPALRALARLMKLGGLKASVPGDNLCMLLERKPGGTQARGTKARSVTQHYGRE